MMDVNLEMLRVVNMDTMRMYENAVLRKNLEKFGEVYRGTVEQIDGTTKARRKSVVPLLYSIIHSNYLTHDIIDHCLSPIIAQISRFYR